MTDISDEALKTVREALEWALTFSNPGTLSRQLCTEALAMLPDPDAAAGQADVLKAADDLAGTVFVFDDKSWNDVGRDKIIRAAKRYSAARSASQST